MFWQCQNICDKPHQSNFSRVAVSSRHEGRRTKMLVGRSLSCCTQGNSVDLEWRSADCGAPWRRGQVRIARQHTAVQGRVNTWTPDYTDNYCGTEQIGSNKKYTGMPSMTFYSQVPALSISKIDCLQRSIHTLIHIPVKIKLTDLTWTLGRCKQNLR